MFRIFSSKGPVACVAFCLFGPASILAGVLAAGAQETGLRGPVSEFEVNADLLPGRRAATDPLSTAATGIPARPYEPVSPGALAEEGSLSDTDDPFQPLDRPAAPNRSTADDDGGEGEDAFEVEQQEADELTTGSAPAMAVGRADNEMLPLRLNERAMPIEGRNHRPEEDPYAPLGLRAGTFILFPTLEQGLTWTSNASNAPNGDEAFLSETTLRLNAVSDWSRHRASFDAFGTFRKSLSGEDVSDPEAGADARLELDLAGGLTGRASLGYRLDRETASSPAAIAGVERQPLRHTIDGSLGLEKSLGRLRLGLTGEISRDQYSDAELVGGSRLPQSDRDATLALMRLRGGYELSPAFIPFVEIEAGRRIYDEDRDSAGYARSADRLGVHAGVALDLSEKLFGEISAGWVSEDYEDSRLETISGLALAASLDWSPRRGTVVSLDASTSVEGSTDAGESGSLLHSGELRVERRMRSNLTGAVALGAAYRDYAGGGHDTILSGEAALTWWLNRYAALTGRARHERQTSSLPGRDYETTSIFMGVRLQR